MTRIFISYARADGAEIATNLANQLRALNHQVFYDVDSLRAGTHWRAELSRRIKWAEIILVVVTPKSNDSDYVYQEVKEAADAGKILIPVKVGSTTLPVHLRGTWQAITFENDNYATVLLEIERTIKEVQFSSKRKTLYLLPVILIVSIGLVGFYLLTQQNENQASPATSTINAIANNAVTPSLEVTEDSLQAQSASDVSTPSPAATSSKTHTSTVTPSATITASSTRTPQASRTPTNTPTTLPVTSILYQEDFEDGQDDLFLDETWTPDRFRVVEDGTGNMVLQASGHPENYLSYSTINRSTNYGVSLRFYYPEQPMAFGLGILRSPTSSCKRYQLHIDPNWHVMEQVYENDCSSSAIDNRNAINKSFLRQRWYEVWIEVRGASIQWRIDNGPMYEVTDINEPIYTTGTFGIDSWGRISNDADVVWFDDIMIWSLEE